MENFLMIMVGGIVNGILFYIVKGYFVGASGEVRRVETALSQRIAVIESKADKITDGQSNIHSEILNKFSRWEDRIRTILDEIVIKQFDKTPVDFKDFVLKSFSELDEAVKKDMSEVKMDMVKLHHHIEETTIIISNNVRISDKEKEMIRDLLKMVEKLEIDRNKEVVEVENKLKSVFSICKIISNDYKELEKKFTTLEQSSKSRIRLKE
jgi:hypothetical protein